jgi:hypothetical protein
VVSAHLAACFSSLRAMVYAATFIMGIPYTILSKSYILKAIFPKIVNYWLVEVRHKALVQEALKDRLPRLRLLVLLPRCPGGTSYLLSSRCFRYV